MIGVNEATLLLKENAFPLSSELVEINEANGRVLAQDIVADRDLPPFNRVMMDGIAILYDSLLNRESRFSIEGIAPAGISGTRLVNPNNALEVMTGAVLPEGTDTVIRYEDIQKQNGVAEITIKEVTRGANIHYKGSDHRQGDTLVHAPVRITPAEIGVAATVGMGQIPVYQMPAILVISTGDELVHIDQKPEMHQVRMSNSFVIDAALSELHCPVFCEHLNDDMGQIRNFLSKWIEQFQVIILTGGSSMGKYDYVPQVLQELQFSTVFYKVKQRPGKPIWFGERNKEIFAFALPGNPVSAFLCLLRYVIPWLLYSAGLKFKTQFGTLAADFSFKPDLTYFLQVDAQADHSGEYVAHPHVGHGSGDLVNLVKVNAFMELPENKEFFKKGEKYPLHFFK